MHDLRGPGSGATGTQEKGRPGQRSPQRVPRGQLVPHVDQPLVGTPAQVANVLATARRQGRLIGATEPRPFAPGDDRVILTLRLVNPPEDDGQRRRRAVTIGTVVALVLAILIGLGWLVYTLIQAAIAMGSLLIGSAVLIVIAWIMLSRVGVCCPGLHCPGCRH